MKEYIITTEKGANQQLHELTRCRDCKKNDSKLCPMLFTEMKDTDFCSYAERKDHEAD